jgi:YesN/AraC family two-component response regulator
MTEDQIANIFNRFYKISGSEYGGTGIGLALVKELVDLFDGDISVSSKPGEGTMFVLKLPIVRNEEIETVELADTDNKLSEAIPQAMSPDELGGQSRPGSSSAQVLLVEDNSDVRQYLAACLRSKYHLLEAKDGQEGLEIAREHMPDLIISDVMMPRMDGKALSLAIKTDPLTSHIPFILLTAKAGRESKIEGLQTGADEYLPKPFDEEELLIRVKNLIEQRKKMRERLGKDIVRLSPEKIQVASADQKFLKRVIEIVETYMGDEAFSIEDMGREIGMSRGHLHRKIKSLTDQSPSVFLRSLRLKRAHQLLQEKAYNVSEIGFKVGFNSVAYFSKCFKDQYGHSPSEI